MLWIRIGLQKSEAVARKNDSPLKLQTRVISPQVYNMPVFFATGS